MLTIEYASQNDNEGIRDVIRHTSMEGPIKMIFDRNPSYFDALLLEGDEHRTIIGRDDKGTVRGVGSCVFSNVYINGNVQRMGYLHNLRLEKAYRDGYSVAMGYRKFRETVTEKNVQIYMTSILSSNEHAKSILTSGKGGLPLYKHLADYSTFIMKSGIKGKEGNTIIKPASQYSIDAIMDFMHKYGKSHNFSPAFSRSDIISHESKHLCLKNILCIERRGCIEGLAGIWDISDKKQLIIAGYSSTLNLIRPFYNINAHLKQKPLLPRPGTLLSYSYVFPFMADNLNSDELIDLISRLSHMSKTSGNDVFIAGCDTCSPIAEKLFEYPSFQLNSEIFLVDWNDNMDMDAINSKHIHIEVARL